MKVKLSTAEKMQPFTLNITLDNIEEVVELYCLFNAEPVLMFLPLMAKASDSIRHIIEHEVKLKSLPYQNKMEALIQGLTEHYEDYP